MGSGQRPQPGPIGLAAGGGLPWVRLVTGIVAVAISLASGTRQEWQAGHATHPTTVHPIEWHAVAGEPLPPLPEDRMRAAPRSERQERSPPATPAVRPPARKPMLAKARAKAPRATTVARASLRHSPHRPPVATVRVAGPIHVAHIRGPRRRADPQREYIAAREQVAALTREDSGSVWLARVAARERASRAGAGRRVIAGGEHVRHGRMRL